VQKIKHTIKRFFFPPAKTPLAKRILPYAVLAVLSLVILIGGSYGWEYSNSAVFCGTSCHTMPPQYSAYLVSPHARVQCVECHIGRDAFASRFTRKAGDLRHVVLNVTKQYEYPIHAKNMRPAREICETCHFPEKFSDDSLQQIVRYMQNEENTPLTLYLIMKTGGGTAREGLGFGIHWHIENKIDYYATDKLEQDIPYVRVTDFDGKQTEYVDVSSDIDPSQIDEKDLVRMDCITCHNRVTHRIPEPDVAVSLAVSKGLISRELPYVVRESVALLRGDYPDQAVALDAMNGLADFYNTNYPELSSEKSEQIYQAIATLQEIYGESVFPEQEIDWDSHPDNLGHKNDPGCFRCHDGKHLTQEGEAVRLECNICHSVPVLSAETQLTTDIEIVSGPEPVSHTLTTWMALHGRVKDNGCKACHSTPEGLDDLTTLEGKPPVDDSFCGNEACHGNVWTYAGFNAPELEAILSEQLKELIAARPPEPVIEEGAALTYDAQIQSLLTTGCSACHGDGATGGLNVSTYQSLLDGGNSGPGIVAGDLEASLVYFRQSQETPHYVQFSEEEVQLLEEWILAGAPEK